MLTTPQFGLVQSRFKIHNNQLTPFSLFDLRRLVEASKNYNGVNNQFYNVHIQQFNNDQFTLTTQSKQQERSGYETPTLTDEYNAHRVIQNDLGRYYGIKFEPFDLHVSNPWDEGNLALAIQKGDTTQTA